MIRNSGARRFRSVAMDCPTCSYPVTADWLTCRRCGAALKIGPESTRITIPSTMHRRQSAPGGAITAAPPIVRPDARSDTPARPYAAPASTPAGMAAALQRRADTRLPGAFPRPDNLLPRAVLGGSTPTIPERRLVNVRARGNGILHEQIDRLRTFVHEHRRRAALLGIAGVALIAGSVRPVLLANETTTFPQTRAAHKAIATDLL